MSKQLTTKTKNTLKNNFKQVITPNKVTNTNVTNKTPDPIANQYRIFIYNCLQGLSLYSHLLRTSFPEIKFEEKKTLGEIMNFSDKLLSKVKNIIFKRKGIKAVKTHEEILDTNSNFMFNWLEIGMCLSGNNEIKEEALNEANNLIKLLNQKYRKIKENEK